MAAFGVSVALGACADEDPRFGGPGAIQNVDVFPTSTSTPPAPPPQSLSARETFEQVVYPAIASCGGGCHIDGGSATGASFIGADPASTYDRFKERGFDKPGSRFYVKGAHTGPALTVEQKALLDDWIVREASDAG